MSLLAPTLQLFFGERMAKQRQASPATITSYRNTFRLLLASCKTAPVGALHAGLERPRRQSHLGLPGPPRNRPAQQRT